jgi:hypothetical protein
MQHFVKRRSLPPKLTDTNASGKSSSRRKISNILVIYSIVRKKMAEQGNEIDFWLIDIPVDAVAAFTISFAIMKIVGSSTKDAVKGALVSSAARVMTSVVGHIAKREVRAWANAARDIPGRG